MKIFLTYSFYFVLAGVLMTSCRNGSGIPSLKETYSRADKNPFGTYVAHRQIGQLFPNNQIRVKKTRLSSSLKEIDDTASLYINVSKNFFLGQEDRNTLLDFVSNGNNVFISSENIDTAFLHTLGFEPGSTEGFVSFADELKDTKARMRSDHYPDTSLFGYFYLPLNSYFITAQPGSLIKLLGNNEEGRANFAVRFYGKGRIYLHCEPRAFSNYFLLQKDNYRYIQHVFSFLPVTPEHIFWDDFYNRRNHSPNAGSGKTGISVLLQYPAMAQAFWLIILLLLLYLVFGSKRRQRIIKPLAANINTSVTFTETVGRLYLQHKDNRNIADKMITYFLEHIRNRYFLNTNSFSVEFISTLSRKSNVPEAQTEKLFNFINSVQQSFEVSDQHLLSLNRQIENFYKHGK